MRNKVLAGIVLLSFLVQLVALTDSKAVGSSNQTAAPQLTQGELRALKSDGATLGLCPLTHTDAQAEIRWLSRSACGFICWLSCLVAP